MLHSCPELVEDPSPRGGSDATNDKWACELPLLERVLLAEVMLAPGIDFSNLENLEELSVLDRSTVHVETLMNITKCVKLKKVFFEELIIFDKFSVTADKVMKIVNSGTNLEALMNAMCGTLVLRDDISFVHRNSVPEQLINFLFKLVTNCPALEKVEMSFPSIKPKEFEKVKRVVKKSPWKVVINSYSIDEEVLKCECDVNKLMLPAHRDYDEDMGDDYLDDSWNHQVES